MPIATFTGPIVLASTSRYRAELLDRLGLPFSRTDPAVDETPLSGESADRLALRLAHAKAAAVAAIQPDALVIGSDQVGWCNRRVLEKPGNAERAVAQLCAAAGQTAEFYTAVAVHQGGRQAAEVVPTQLRFRQFSAAQARAYVAQDKAWDCAGGFKAEALGIALFETVTADDPTALIGLPLIATVSLLAQFGVYPLG